VQINTSTFALLEERPLSLEKAKEEPGLTAVLDSAWTTYPAAEGSSFFSESMGSSLILDIYRVIKSLLLMGIDIPQIDDVVEYLLEFPDMILTTERIARRVCRELYNSAQLSLEVYRDPEIEDRYLVLYARFPKYDESTIEKIEAVENEYIDLLVGKRGWLLLTTDFRPAAK